MSKCCFTTMRRAAVASMCFSQAVFRGEACNAPSVRGHMRGFFRLQHELLNDGWKGLPQLFTPFFSPSLAAYQIATEKGSLSFIKRQGRFLVLVQRARQV